MKNIQLSLITLILLFCLAESHAQKYFNIHNPIILPDKSQEAFIQQRIGYTDISISYHSPGAKGREVWGGLVPLGRVWRTGANENTIFTITHDAKINGQSLLAGSYGLHLLAEEEEWTFIFSKNHTSWGSYFYDEKEDALRVKVKVEDAPEFREWMSFEFHKRDRNGTTIALTWADQRAMFEVSLDIDDIALDNIRKQLKSDAYWEWFSWCQAAAYCAEYEINTVEALEWIDRSITLQANFSNHDVKADLLRQSGDDKGAATAIEKAIELGTAIELERYGRRFLRQEDYDRAVFLFSKSLEKNDQYWRAYFNKGNALQGKGDKKEALKSYKSASKYAPEGQKEMLEKKMASLK